MKQPQRSNLELLKIWTNWSFIRTWGFAYKWHAPKFPAL